MIKLSINKRLDRQLDLLQTKKDTLTRQLKSNNSDELYEAYIDIIKFEIETLEKTKNQHNEKMQHYFQSWELERNNPNLITEVNHYYEEFLSAQIKRENSSMVAEEIRSTNSLSFRLS